MSIDIYYRAAEGVVIDNNWYEDEDGVIICEPQLERLIIPMTRTADTDTSPETPSTEVSPHII